MKVNEIDLKTIVPDLQKRCEKLQKASKIMMIAAFLIIPAVPAMIVMSKYGYNAQLCRIVNYVKAQEKVPLTQVLGYAKNSVQAAQKLIDTGNLEGYRIVAGAMLVKEGVEITEEDALKEAAAYYNLQTAVNMGMDPNDMPEVAKMAAKLQQANLEAAAAQNAAAYEAQKAADKKFCPECGKPLPGKGEKFCPECGAALK
ncbi:MAG TPA: zinc-ribbon domain-containing protein [Candidatus Caccalectryoclostridium excrementigallinarum]|uniref:Zinc-ribbon domain-containing protein n=1 Tax=Candidatus Caccalectryoclostridium excrementigallinarum TaxID=2840710 RepID=A0A9D1MMM2_9FIRM|nr:zinc-ribbon domain-containing protein [Candidatus Caccalectryoclostridium excrementigallinarum]